MEADISVGDVVDRPDLTAHLEDSWESWRVSDYYEEYIGSTGHLSYLPTSTESYKSKTMGMRDIYEGEDASTRMEHLMHSDTIIVVIALIVMIVLGLIFRSLCMRLTRKNVQKDRVRGGLRAMAEHMNVVTRSMSNDLEVPDSPKAVMRTYSNYGRMKPSVEEKNKEEGEIKPVPVRHQSRENLRVQAFSNLLAKETERQIIIEMTESLPSPEERKR